MDELDALHNSTLARAQESLAKARVVYDEALSLSTEASSIVIPDIEVEELRRTAEDIKNTAQSIKDELEGLLRNNRDLLVDIGTEVEGAKELVERGLRQQEVTKQLLAEVFTNKQKAEEAVQKADKTLEEAQNTLMILEGN